jgi:hypothetical protein
VKYLSSSTSFIDPAQQSCTFFGKDAMQLNETRDFLNEQRVFADEALDGCKCPPI